VGNHEPAGEGGAAAEEEVESEEAYFGSDMEEVVSDGDLHPQASDEHGEESSELVEVVGAAWPGLVDFGLRPEDQPDLWEGMFGSEEEESLGIVH
jgi:hypothetical protein